MPARLLIFVANAFVIAYSADAGLSLLEEGFRQLSGSHALIPLRDLLAGLVVMSSLLSLPAMVLTPRLPASVLALLALSALWMASGAAPLPLLLGRPALDFSIAALQLALAAIAFLRIRSLSGGRGWLLGSERLERPAFSLAHSLRAAGAVVVGAVALVLVYLPLWLLSSIQVMTDGFVRFDLAGVSLADRRFQRDGQEIRLVGMMHIGESGSYEALVESFSGSSTVVLEEGVTDEKGLLRQPLSYERVARTLGLETQGAIRAYLENVESPGPPEWPAVRHADVDLSDFHPATLEWLEWASGIWDGEDPLRAIGQLYARYAEDPARWAVLEEDVLILRNVHLIEELRNALVDYDRVIVPWGALHQPFLQHQVLEMGFEPTSATHHLLISWRTIADALLPAWARAP